MGQGIEGIAILLFQKQQSFYNHEELNPNCFKQRESAMFGWLRNFIRSTGETKFFIFNWAIYGILIVLTTAYAYGRLEIARTRPAPAPAVLEKQQAPLNNP